MLRIDHRFANRLRDHLARLYPDMRLVAIEPLAPDTGATKDSTAKAAGYGMPVRLRLAADDGRALQLVWRTATANEFGHDRRADRAGGMLLAYDDFARIPHHVAAVDVGTIDAEGTLRSLPAAGEVYLITTYARGAIYADDLRRVASDGAARDLDVARVDALARYLAALHVPAPSAHGYRRAIRDLIGHGEGIFGIVDGYPADTPAAPAERLRAIEQRCNEWRWHLRGHDSRLARTHGDFHPFNVVFDAGTSFTLLDASRGTAGDPADDITAMAVNYVLFALQRPASWRRGLGTLWHRFWRVYEEARPDPMLRAVAPPFFAWRALVVCNPRFYPDLAAPARDALLGFATRVLDARRLEPAWADELFA
jgi:hypothetical protein